MDEKLVRKDFVFIIICLAIIGIGLIIGLTYFQKAFPEASIDFKVTRAESKTLAVDFLKKQHLDPEQSGYHNASGFRFDNQAKTFLEKELGLAKAQEYFGHPVKLWYWKQRWFKPEQKEEFSVMITPEGNIMGFDHEIPEEQAGDSLSTDSARSLADGFLQQVMGRDLTTLEFVTVSQQVRPHRIDHYFTYKVKGFNPAADSDYRLSVIIQGNEVSAYREYLRVPEVWKQSYEELRSYNETTGQIASLLIILTIVAMVAVIFSRIRKRNIRWKTAAWFGIVGFALSFLSSLNTLPLTMLSYDTTASYSGFLISRIARSLLFALLEGGVLIFILTAAAETMYRERYGNFTSINRMFSWGSFRTKSFFKGILLGITLTAFFFAYQIVFYLIANKWGAWSPADVPYDNLLNTAFPWLAVLLIGFIPAVSEEFISRAFSIPFLHKYLKSGILAIVIPAFIWGFGHASYPNQPFYIRGLEVGIGGIIIGLVMIKWGILPTLVWHYTVDALYTAFLLFRSGNWYFIVTAVVATGILVIPLLIALITYLRTGKFLSPVGIRNQDEVIEPIPETVRQDETTPSIGRDETRPSIEIGYQPLTTRVRIRGFVLGIICLLITLIPFHKIGEDAPKFNITSKQALAIADRFIVQQGVNPQAMKYAVGIDQRLDENTGKYFLTHGTIENFNRLAKSTIPANVWDIRRFTPGNRDEWRIKVQPETGKIIAFKHFLPEEAKGDSLSLQMAQGIAETFLVEQGVNLKDFVSKGSTTDKRPNRMDYGFTYEAKEGDSQNVLEAKYRISVDVSGSYVTRLSPYYKIPESWERERESTTSLKAAFAIVRIVAIALFFGLGILYLVLLSKKGIVPWGKAAVIALIPAVIMGVNSVNFFTQFMYRYEVTTPFAMYQIQLMVAYVLGMAGIYVIWFLGTALLLGCYPKALTDFRGVNRRLTSSDSITAAFLALCFGVLFSRVHSVLEVSFPHWVPFSGISVSDAVAMPLPFLAVLVSSLTHTLLILLVAGFGIYLWNNVLRKSWMRILAVILYLFALTPNSAKDAGEAILSGMNSILLLVLFMFIAVRYLRNNTVAFIASAFALSVFRGAMQLFEAGATVYFWHGILLLLIGVAVLIWLMTGKSSSKLSEGAK
jgi:membrane protease YdiL (CAAX protease family)